MLKHRHARWKDETSVGTTTRITAAASTRRMSARTSTSACSSSFFPRGQLMSTLGRFIELAQLTPDKDPLEVARLDLLLGKRYSGKCPGRKAYAHIELGSMRMKTTPSPRSNGLEP